MVTRASLAPTWVAALPSDDEDEKIPSTHKLAEALAELEEPDCYIVEEEDVQILNITRLEQLPRYDNTSKATSDNLFKWSLSLRESDSAATATGVDSCAREVYKFTAGVDDPLIQSNGGSLRKLKKNELRQQRKLRAATFLAQGLGRNGDVAAYNKVVRTEPTAQTPGFDSVARGRGLERLLNGNTTREWWNSLRACQGTELSNLHWNVLQFCKIYELTPEQMLVRRDALEYVTVGVHEIWPTAEVQLFGSTATGLALPWSDIDVAVMSPRHNGSWQKPSTMSWLSALSQNLKRHGQCKSVRPIPFAKVPILKVVFKSGLACDISFDVHNGPRGVPVIREFMRLYEAMRPLCLVLKFFLGKKSLNELYTGGIGSFCLINMVASHLQNLGVHGPGHDLGILLLSFFTHYTSMHNYSSDVVCTRAGSCPSKQARGWVKVSDPELLSCEDPLDPTSDIAKGSYKIHEARQIFSRAKRSLIAHWYEKNVLDHLVDTNISQSPAMDVPGVGSQSPVGKKKLKQKKRKRKYQDEEEDKEEDPASKQTRKKRKAQGKSSQQVSGTLQKSPQKPKKKNERKEGRKRQVEKILLDFWDSHSHPRLKPWKSTSRRQSW